ncbi:MAG: carboxypeptidase-like regulatory domain-containing protein [Terriglobia bacterium]
MSRKNQGVRNGAIVALAITLALPVCALGAASAGRITGRVVNGTTGRPAARQTVVLLTPGTRAVQQIATTRTDAAGRFTFSSAAIKPKSFYLVQATRDGVDYHAPVRLGAAARVEADLKVYNSVAKVPPLRITSARFLVHAKGNKIQVEELFALRNTSNPPVAYADPQGTFRFDLAQGVGQPSVAVAGEMNMPLPQDAQPGAAPGEYFIRYPLKPGLTVVMVAYAADYSSGGFILADSVPYPVERVEMDVVPSTLKVKSPIFTDSGHDADTGGEKFVAQNLKPSTTIEASFQGTAVTAGESEGGDEQTVKEVPNPMTRLGLPLLGCFLLVLLWAMGVRVSKEWSRRGVGPSGPAQKELEAKLDKLLDSVANLDELFEGGKVPEKKYWRERLDLKAKLVVLLKKSPPAFLEAYAARNNPP